LPKPTIILRLAERSETWARMRTALCALFSANGAFGFANGVEWYATEKINVHGAPSLNWGSERNQVDHIQRINAILKCHPAFHDQVHLKLIQCGPGNHVVMLRHHIPTGKRLVVAVNLNDDQEAAVCWKDESVPRKNILTDLLSGEKVTPDQMEGHFRMVLQPGRVLCLTADESDLEMLSSVPKPDSPIPERIRWQQLRAKILEIWHHYHGGEDLGAVDPNEMAARLSRDPVGFCAELNPEDDGPGLVSWRWPMDVRRQVMVPPGHFLWVTAETAFRVNLRDEENSRVIFSEASFRLDDGRFHVLMVPGTVPETHTHRILALSVFEGEQTRHVEAHLLFLCHHDRCVVRRRLEREEGKSKSLLLLGTNGRGAMMRAPISWGELPSRYDALLAANMDPDYPEDRMVLFTRCRGWVRFQGYSQSMDAHCFDAFDLDFRSRGCWGFKIPTGQGEHVHLRVFLKMAAGENRIQMAFYRDPAQGAEGRLSDSKPVEIILRPDIEWRSFHEATKAYLGPESHFPESVTPMVENPGFLFSPRGPEQKLSIHMSAGTFRPEPEWQYMVHHSEDAQRGFDGDSDLFSPGYFSVFLEGGDRVTLTAGVTGESEKEAIKGDLSDGNVSKKLFHKKEPLSPMEVLHDALDQYVVKRGDMKTVIAGYPWFLDWGRDSLIFVRGLVAAGKTEDAKAVLTQFGRFEQKGDPAQHDSRFRCREPGYVRCGAVVFVACGDLLKKEGDAPFSKPKRADAPWARSLFHRPFSD
jgi:starch synthase (maltosyl-transferring)